MAYASSSTLTTLPSPETLLITKTGLVYDPASSRAGARMQEFILKLGDQEVEASFDKYKQTAVFKISEGVALFMHDLLNLWLRQEGVTGVQVQDLREGTYPLQLKVNYKGEKVRTGELVRLTGVLKCYVYTRPGAGNGAPPTAGVSFSPKVDGLTPGHLL